VPCVLTSPMWECVRQGATTLMTTTVGRTWALPLRRKQHTVQVFVPCASAPTPAGLLGSSRAPSLKNQAWLSVLLDERTTVIRTAFSIGLLSRSLRNTGQRPPLPGSFELGRRQVLRDGPLLVTPKADTGPNGRPCLRTMSEQLRLRRPHRGRQHASFDLACHSSGCSPVQVRQQFGCPPA
jgi:hypothetical protein